jgi:hypothetical protein
VNARDKGLGIGPTINIQDLVQAGVHYDSDTIYPLEQAGIVRRAGYEYGLTDVTREMLRRFTVAEGPETRLDFRVDYPQAFVVMPFSQPWSNDVYNQFFKPGIENANFSSIRGDAIVRFGDLSKNVWNSITQAGVVVAEVSVPNPNVYYELGLAEALGKPTFLFKQKDVSLPADFGGAHYYEYDLKDLSNARQLLTDELVKLANEADRRFFGVKALADKPRP